MRFSRDFALLSVLAASMLAGTAVRAQTIDCGQLRQQIARSDQGGGNRYASAARKQSAELAKTQRFAHQLGCDQGGFLFFGGGSNDPRCGGLNQRIQQMQANLGQLQSAGGGGRSDLVARYNAYCRGGQPQPERPRGFFESLFGGGDPQPRQAPVTALPPDGSIIDEGDGSSAHGGGQAVCVRTCDGGFFPLPISSRHGKDELKEMCSALCPGTETAVYTRSPDADIKSAMGIDGKPYVDMPNALKFTKNYSEACSCRPAGKSWAETLANAEEVLDNTRKGDIMVTPEKSDELSRPKMDAKTRSTLLKAPLTAAVAPADASKLAADAATAQSSAVDPTIAAGVKKPVRQVGPQP